jgi:hypothetical protein
LRMRSQFLFPKHDADWPWRKIIRAIAPQYK